MDESNEEQSLQEIVDKGSALYEAVKGQYEPHDKGKFLAIEVEKGNFYIGDTTREAIGKARAANPGKLFYLVRIGFSSMEVLTTPFMGRPW